MGLNGEQQEQNLQASELPESSNSNDNSGASDASDLTSSGGATDGHADDQISSLDLPHQQSHPVQPTTSLTSSSQSIDTDNHSTINTNHPMAINKQQTNTGAASIVSRPNVVSPVTRPPRTNLASIHSLHPQMDLKLNARFMLMPMNDQIRELQTVIRDRETSRGDFKFYADRLIRLVVEEGLNQLPIEKYKVETPTGNYFEGIRYLKGNCGVSIVRSGESMEQGLRDCCRSIRIGKILIESDENNQARVLYAKFPKDIALRKILLLYPIMSTGLAVIESVRVLLNHGVKEENLILLNLFSSPRASKMIASSFPKMFVLTSDINPVCPNHFGQRYFGTD